MTMPQDEVIELNHFDSSSRSGSSKCKPQMLSPSKSSPLSSSNNKNVSDIFVNKPQASIVHPTRKKGTLKKVKSTSFDKSSVTNSLDDSDMTHASNEKITETSKSDARSYREKIRERFRTVKDRAGSSLSRAHELRKFSMRSGQNISVLKSLELMKEENVLINAEIKDYEKKLLDKRMCVSYADRYNFFCEEIVINDNTNQLREDIAETHIQEDINEIHINNTAGDLTEMHTDLKPVHCLLPALLQDYIEIAENDLFWQPTRDSLPLRSKLEYEEPRLLAEEGLYVPNIQKILYLNVLEQRLLALNDKKWFNCDGNLKILESPLSPNSYRPIQSPLEELETEYALPTIEEKYNDMCQSIAAQKPNILEINIMTIKFEHHPLFSVEHIFERRLISLYDSYREKITQNNFDRITKKLQALRSVKHPDHFTHAEGDNKNTEFVYINEIKNLRELLFEEGKEYRDNIKSILQTWKIIKNIREQNTYTNTSVKLTIHKETCNLEEEKQILEVQINKTVSEIKNEMQYEYTRRLNDYREKIEEWRTTKKGKGESDTSLKPKKPSQDTDEEEIKEDITNKFRQSFKQPGEPILHFSISYENQITKEADEENEKLRRQAIKTSKVYLKILCNNVAVCKSKLVALNETFACVIDEAFSLQLSTIPNCILIEIYEQSSTIMKRKIGEVPINLPRWAVPFNNDKTLEENFGKDELIHYKHAGVGSGQEISRVVEKYNIPTQKNYKLNTSGSIRYHIGWEKTNKNVSEVTYVSEKEVHPKYLNGKGFTNSNQLSEWVKNTNIDPQDPKNMILFECIDGCASKLPSTNAVSKKYFRCSPNLQSLVLYEFNAIHENIRLKVLELRNNNEPEFIGMIVPNRIKEIPSNILSAYKERIHEEQKNSILDNASDKTFDERCYGKKYLKEIYTKVFQQCRSTGSNFEYEDVVNEKLIPYCENWIKTLTANILNWFKIQPNISKPLPKLAKSDLQEKSVVHNVAVNIFVNVISALHVPKRKSSRKQSRSRSSEASIAQEVATFIQVDYQDMILRTTVQEGVNPKWDETLIFPLQTSSKDYLSPSSLSGSILLNLFEETVENVSEKKLQNWLGYIKIPLSAVWFSGKMEGLFQVISPILFNHEQSPDRIQHHTSRTSTNTNFIYVSLKLWIEPKVPKLTINMAEFPTSEPPYLQKYILEWNERHNNSFPHRKFSAFAIDINGKTLCLTRFIRPLEPPQMNSTDFDLTPEQCARYVSLIPFTECNKFYDQVWLSTEQMLNLMLGSITDHAIALTCYFLALNLETWLLLGYGLPNGRTAYVLVREYNSDDIPVYYIYDTVTANKYSTNDSYCPIQKAFLIVNDVNIWANVQRSDNINLTRFDFLNRSDWHPLFNNQVAAPSNSLQQKLCYGAVNDVQVLGIQIEKKLRKKMTKLRKIGRIYWNHQISGVFKNILTKLEHNYLAGRADINMYIHGIEATHTVHGFIIDLPYMNLTTALDIIKFSQISNVDFPGAEFISAVHTCSYPNQVSVVWIMLGFVISKQ